jgi:hypothetical protein
MLDCGHIDRFCQAQPTRKQARLVVAARLC